MRRKRKGKKMWLKGEVICLTEIYAKKKDDFKNPRVRNKDIWPDISLDIERSELVSLFKELVERKEEKEERKMQKFQEIVNEKIDILGQFFKCLQNLFKMNECLCSVIFM
ncbi:uncharacterized protein LOC111328992 [Stylophora pistillata]|uniref:uncharacterized protein LOC111328992 n=1 Tax=Stylophora pistillata TaxID=50429 RepID=UPI000C055E30|nr:uncharacterized protein LOC111328992 [Stylophora pistillata]